MICYVQFWNGTCCDTNFLFIENVLENATSANSETLHRMLQSRLQSLGLDIRKLSGVSTDGASVMVGKRAGLVQKMKADNPSLVAIHCICHRLALACNWYQYRTSIHQRNGVLHDTNMENLPLFICEISRFIEGSDRGSQDDSVWNYNKAANKDNEKTCQTIWLSFNSAVQSLYQELVSVVQTLNMFSSVPTSYGLMKKITTLKFIGTLYVLQRVLPILSDLSKLFQRGNVNFSMICPGLESTKHKLKSLSQDEIFECLIADLGQNGRLCT